MQTWTRDEFGHLHIPFHFGQIEAEDSPGNFRMVINGHPASRPYPLQVTEETLNDLAAKIQTGVRFLDLGEIIRRVQADLTAPLPEGVQPWPPRPADSEGLH
ncbi:MAG: hypothetical protein QME75_13105 [Deltaproteobacteria bacterium]|nr:hypothetical protein [Deltaproteobacteria bacterium]